MFAKKLVVAGAAALLMTIAPTVSAGGPCATALDAAGLADARYSAPADPTAAVASGNADICVSVGCGSTGALTVNDDHPVTSTSTVVTNPDVPATPGKIVDVTVPAGPVVLDNDYVDVTIPGGTQHKRIELFPIDPLDPENHPVNTPGATFHDCIVVPNPTP